VNTIVAFVRNFYSDYFTLSSEVKVMHFHMGNSASIPQFLL